MNLNNRTNKPSRPFPWTQSLVRLAVHQLPFQEERLKYPDLAADPDANLLD